MSCLDQNWYGEVGLRLGSFTIHFAIQCRSIIGLIVDGSVSFPDWIVEWLQPVPDFQLPLVEDQHRPDSLLQIASERCLV